MAGNYNPGQQRTGLYTKILKVGYDWTPFVSFGSEGMIWNFTHPPKRVGGATENLELNVEVVRKGVDKILLRHLLRHI